MKKIPCSIAQYTLRNVNFNIAGHEGPGIKTELSKGTTVFCTIEDWGDGGGMNPHLKSDFKSENDNVIRRSKEKAKELLKTYNEIFDEVGEEKSLGDNKKNKDNIYFPMVQMTELLLEVYDLKQTADGRKKEQRKDQEIVVVSTGKSRFDGLDFSTHNFEQSSTYTLLMPPKLLNASKKEKLKHVATAFNEHLSEVKTLGMIKFIAPNTKRVWSMSTKDFCQMFIDGREATKFLSKLKKKK